MIKLNLIAGLALVACLSSCATDQDANDLVPASAFQELYEQGIDRYLGAFTPTTTEASSSTVSEHIFEGLEAPLCYTGNQFSMFTRDGSNNQLMIFLQGGGFCGPAACAALETGIPFLPFGILNPNDGANPTADFNVGYVPYCDGTSMIGDNEVDIDNDDEIDRTFRGLQNLSASLDVIKAKYSSPETIVLAGNSAGGFAVIFALPLVRKLYPNALIQVINDSGIGIFDPGGMDRLNDYWNSSAFFPASCTDCIGEDGNLTGYHKYLLSNDRHMELSYISSKQDQTIAAGLAGGGAALEEELIEAANELKADYPDRFQYLIANGNEHTFILSNFNYSIGGTTIKEWVSAMMNDSENWNSIIE